MITTFFLQIFLSFLNLLVNLLPAGHLPSPILSAFTYFMGVLNAYSFVVPVDTLLQAAGVILVFDGTMLVWYFVNWIIRKVPGMQ
jgi:hypothetical protein